MGTVIRADISQRNKYWIDKHRYYELKHFCLQYPTWKKAYASLDGLSNRPSDLAAIRSTNISDPTAKCAEAKLYYAERMKLVEQAAIDADPELVDYIMKGVTEERSYDYLKTNFDIPCGKDTYYDRYRKFFWILNRTRN